ncbi:MAG: hypothetical protein AB1427_19250 [Thermodesulfobacteriota bacterium]
MAQRIKAFEEFPIYCWEAQYGGAVVSYVAAIIFHFGGSGFFQLHLTMFPVAVATLVLFYYVYRKMFNAMEALIGVFFLIFCPYFFLRHTMGAYGGYGETGLGVALIILISWRIREELTSARLPYLSFLLGAVSGFFFYILFLVLPAVIAFAVPEVWRAHQRRGATVLSHFCLGGVIGLLPMIIHSISSRGGIFLRAAGRSLSIGREAMQMTPAELAAEIFSAKILYFKTWLFSLPYMLGNFVLPEIFGKRVLETAGIFLAAAFIGFYYMVYKNKTSSDINDKFRQFAVFLALLFLFQWVANLNRTRHLLPLLFIIPVVLLSFMKCRPHWKTALICLMVITFGSQAYGVMQQMNYSMWDPGPAVRIMKEIGTKEFYGSYWTTYPIMFVSQGELIGSPSLLPYNEILSDRRPEDTKRIRASLRPAFVFAKNEKKIKADFQKYLTDQNITARSVNCPNATIFYDFSKIVHAVVERKWETTFISIEAKLTREERSNIL